MPIDRKELKKKLAGLSKEDRDAFIEALEIEPETDGDLLDTVTSLSARLEALEKKLDAPADPEPKPKKKKGFLEDIFGGE